MPKLRGHFDYEHPPHEYGVAVAEVAKISSVGALPHAFGPIPFGLRMFWFIMFTLGMLATIVHSWVLIARYFSRPVQVTISLRSNETFEFPSVTICNLNPVEADALACGDLSQLARVQQEITRTALNDKTFEQAMLAVSSTGKSPIEWLQSSESTKFIRTPKQLDDLCIDKSTQGQDNHDTHTQTSVDSQKTKSVSSTISTITSESSAVSASNKAATLAMRNLTTSTSTTPTPSLGVSQDVKNIISTKLSATTTTTPTPTATSESSRSRTNKFSVRSTSTATVSKGTTTKTAVPPTTQSNLEQMKEVTKVAVKVLARNQQNEATSNTAIVTACPRGESPRYCLMPDFSQRLFYGTSVLPDADGSVEQCREACNSGQGLEGKVCESFEITNNYCRLAAFKLDPTNIEVQGNQRRNMNYYHKLCVSDVVLLKLPMNECHMASNRILVGSVKRTVQATTLTDCLSQCQFAPVNFGFTCRSIMLYPTGPDQKCLLSTETQFTQKKMFVEAGYNVLYADMGYGRSPNDVVQSRSQSRRRKRQTSEECGTGFKNMYCRADGLILDAIDETSTVKGDYEACKSSCNRNKGMAGQSRCLSFDSVAGSCILSSIAVNFMENDLKTQDGSSYHHRTCVQAEASARADLCSLSFDYILVGHVQNVTDVSSLDECVQDCLNSMSIFGIICHSAMWYPNEDAKNCLVSTESKHTMPDVFVKSDFATVYFDFGDGTARTDCCDCSCDDDLDSSLLDGRTATAEELDQLSGELGLNGDNQGSQTTTAKPVAAESFMDQFSESDQYEFGRFVKESSLDDLVDVQDLISFTPSLIDAYSTDVSKFIIECTIDRERCLPQYHFRRMINKRYGACYTFNSAASDSPLRVTRKSGSRHGLRLTLNINATQYVGLLASSYGVRVSIHAPDEQPLPDQNGFNAQPGLLTTAAVSRTDIRRLRAPYDSNCTDNFPQDYKPFTGKDSRYNFAHCQLACADHHLLENCDCVETSHDHKVCSVFNEKERTCRADVLDRMSENKLSCVCPQQCSEIKFEHDLSLSTWPSDQYRALKLLNFANGQHALADQFMQSTIKDALGKSTEHTAQMSKDLLSLHVYLKSMTIQVVEESAAYPFSQLLADAGGVCGWYLGLTVVTMFEVVNLALAMLAVHCARKKKRNSVGHVEIVVDDGSDEDVEGANNSPSTSTSSMIQEIPKEVVSPIVISHKPGWHERLAGSGANTTPIRPTVTLQKKRKPLKGRGAKPNALASLFGKR